MFDKIVYYSIPAGMLAITIRGAALGDWRVVVPGLFAAVFSLVVFR